MLGIGKGLTRGNTLRSIVKRKLQAWYKADKTQAPLGEEEIANGDFNEKGSDLIAGEGGLTSAFTGGDFTHHSDGTMTINGDGNRNWAGDNIEADSTYKVTVDIVSGTAGKFFIGGTSSSVFSGTGFNIRYIKSASSSLTYVSFNDCDGMVIRSCSVERIDPNDSWTTNAGTTVKDGEVFLDATNSGTATQANAIVSGKKYQYSLQAKSGSGTSGTVKLADGTGTHLTQASVPATYTTYTGSFTAGNTSIQLSEAGSGGVYVKNVSVKEITNSVKDFSPNTNNGVLYSGKALHFAQADDYIDIDYWKSKTINTDTKATFAVWFNCDDVNPPGAAGAMIFGVAGSGRFYLGAKGAKLELGWDEKGWQSYDTMTGSVPALGNDIWYRAVVVVDGLTCSVYLNGELAFSKKTPNSSFTLDDNGVYIGSEGDINSNIWYGELSDFQIYDKAWTASDVTYDWENPDKDVFDDEGRTEVLGAETLNNNDFSLGNNGDWSKSQSGSSTVDFSVAGKVTVNVVDGSDVSIFQDFGAESGKTYRLNATIKGLSGSSGKSIRIQDDAGSLQMGTSSHFAIALDESVQTVEITWIADDDSDNIIVNRNSGSANSSNDYSFEVHDISVKEVTTHAGEISPTDCTALYRLNEGAGNRVYNAAPVLGAELITNGDFATGTSAGWAHSGGTIEVVDYDGKTNALHVSTTSSNQGVNQVILQTNTTYLVKFDLKVISGYVFLGKYGHEVTGTYIGVSPWTSYEVNWTSSDDNYFRAYSSGAAAEFYIDNVSVKEIRLSDSYVQASWASSNWITAQPYIPQYAMSSYSKKMLFDGSDNLVDCGEDTAIDNIFDGGGTWSAWFSAETDGESDTGTILSKAKTIVRTTAGGGGDVTMEFIHFFNTQEGKWTCPTDAVLLNKINHILIVYDNSNVSNNPIIYINGVSQTVTRTQAPIGTFTTDASDELTIGAKDDGGVDCFDGFIDEVSVWGKELTAAEAQEIFNAGMALDCRDHSAFLGDEEFDDPGFDDPLKWSISAGWVVSGGKASVDNDSNVKITQLLDGVTAGKMYDISFEISDYTQGSFQFAYGRFHLIGTSTTIPNVQGNGTYKYRVIAQGSDPFYIHLYSYNPSKFSIDNVSVKEVDLKGYWRNNGLDDWTDLSPYGNDGDVQNAEVAEVIQLQEVPYFKKDTFGLPMNRVRERALNLDGDSYVEIADDGSLDFGTGAFSIDGWARFTFENSGDTRNIIFVNGGNPVGSTSGSFAILTKIDGGNRHLVFTVNNVAIDANINSRVADGDWFHFAGTRDTSGDLELYVDSESVGALSATGNSGATVDTGSVRYIGRDSETTRYYKNLIDDIRLYDRELLAAEVAKNFKATKSKHKNNIVSNWSDDFSDSFI